MDDDLIVLELEGDKPADGAKVQAVLDAHIAFETAQVRRSFLVHVLAATSTLVWLVASWSRAPAPLRGIALGSWVVCAAGALVAVASEVQCRRRRDGLLAALGAKPPRARVC